MNDRVPQRLVDHLDVRGEQSQWSTSFRAGLFAWPALHREILHACATAGVTHRTVRARWRGMEIHVELELEGEAERVRCLQRFMGDLVAQV